MLKERRQKITLSVAMCAVVACNSDSAETDVSWIDESASVVVSASARWASGEEWVPVRAYSIQPGSGEFGEVTGLDVDDDGNVYVADRQAQRVAVFDPTGRQTGSIGRPGEGPGELGTNIRGVFLRGDEVMVPDPANGRVSVFSLSGSFLRSLPVRAEDGVPIRWDHGSDGQLIAQRRQIVPGDDAPTTGDAVVVVSDKPQTAPVVRLPFGQTVQITGQLPVLKPFAPEAVWDSTVDGRRVIARTDQWHLQVSGPDGSTAFVAKREIARQRASRADQEAVRNSLLRLYQGQGVPKDLARRIVDQVEFDRDLPAFAGLSFGPRGSLWVQHALPPSSFTEGRPRTSTADWGARDWSVFDSDGGYLGVVSFPEDFQPVRAAGDLFYGVVRDDLEQQHVVAYRILE